MIRRITYVESTNDARRQVDIARCVRTYVGHDILPPKDMRAFPSGCIAQLMVED